MAAFFCRFIHIFEMLRNSCMCIKAVYNIEPLCIFRCLYRKICCASAADDQNVDLVLHLLCFVHMADLSCLCKYFYCLRITACKNCRKFQIRIVFHCTFHASAQVAISHDSNSNTHNNFLLVFSAYILIFQRNNVNFFLLFLTNFCRISYCSLHLRQPDQNPLQMIFGNGILHYITIRGGLYHRCQQQMTPLPGQQQLQARFAIRHFIQRSLPAVGIPPNGFCCS